jgi:hypothetical protein
VQQTQGLIRPELDTHERTVARKLISDADYSRFSADVSSVAAVTANKAHRDRRRREASADDSHDAGRASGGGYK